MEFRGRTNSGPQAGMDSGPAGGRPEWNPGDARIPASGPEWIPARPEAGRSGIPGVAEFRPRGRNESRPGRDQFRPGRRAAGV